MVWETSGGAIALGNDGLRPNKREPNVRLACGAVLGAFVGSGLAFQLGSVSARAVAFAAVVSRSIVGLLASSLWRSLQGGGSCRTQKSSAHSG